MVLRLLILTLALALCVCASELHGRPTEALLAQRERLSERAKSLRAVADSLVVDARSLSDRTSALSVHAKTLRIEEEQSDRLRGDDEYGSDGTRRSLRRPCTVTECGVSCLRDCLSQCRVAKVLELPMASCGKHFCARSCAVGCSEDSCSFRFVLGA